MKITDVRADAADTFFDERFQTRRGNALHNIATASLRASLQRC